MLLAPWLGALADRRGREEAMVWHLERDRRAGDRAARADRRRALGLGADGVRPGLDRLLCRLLVSGRADRAGRRGPRDQPRVVARLCAGLSGRRAAVPVQRAAGEISALVSHRRAPASRSASRSSTSPCGGSCSRCRCSRWCARRRPTARRTGWRELWETVRGVLRDRPVLHFLLAYWLYIDAIGTLQQMAVDFGTQARLFIRRA